MLFDRNTCLRILPCVDPYGNLAAEEALLTGRCEDYILLWRNAPCVILGKNQCAEAETSAQCRSEVPVLHRSTGGGAVYHDLNNINYSFIRTEKEMTDVQCFLHIIMDFLHQFDINVVFSGRNDLLLPDGSKISGCAFRRADNRTLVHGTLLFRRDAEKMERYLTPSPEKLLRHGVASVRSRTGELAPFLPFDTAEACMQALYTYLENRLKESSCAYNTEASGRGDT